uniref:Uncharacterized protein n=1 Tax=Pelagomonas calceolata TaxID=35677 RepID=A0A7S4A2N2_9STRA
MGSGASTDKKPLTEVRLKSEVGVLFDDKAKRAFDAAATEGPDGTRTVPWPTIEAHAKEHDERALDPRKCMFHNLKARALDPRKCMFHNLKAFKAIQGRAGADRRDRARAHQG